MQTKAKSAHRATTYVLSVTIGLLGLAMIVTALASGGGIASLGVLTGVLFIALAAARTYLLRR